MDFSTPNQILWKHFRSRARQRSSSQDQVSLYFWVFVLHTIYRLPNAIKVISDVPVNHLWGLVSLSRKIKSRREIFNRTGENWKVRRFSASLLRRVCYFSRWTLGKNIAQSFLSTNNRIIKLFLFFRTFYSPSRGQKIGLFTSLIRSDKLSKSYKCA